MTDWTTWCQACDWNVVTTPAQPVRGLARWRRQIAQRVGTRMHADLVAGRGAGPLERVAGMALLVLTTGILLSFVSCLGLLVWAVRADTLGLGHWVVVGLLGLLVLLVLPRPHRLDDEVVLVTRQQAPGLWALVDETAAAVGARAPALLGFDRDLNAYVTRSGWRWRSTLVYGLPLWSVQEPQERVACLAHELGHLRHGDVGRLVPVVLAQEGVERLVEVLWPDGVDENPASDEVSFLAAVTNPFRRLLVAPLVGVLLLVSWLQAWAGQRHEYRADLASARVAGTAAARTGLLRLLGLPGLFARMQGAVRRREDIWRALASAPTPDGRELQRLLRESELVGHQVNASHPPTHLRVLLVQTTPAASATVVVDGGRQQLLDRELAPVRDQMREKLTDDLLE